MNKPLQRAVALALAHGACAMSRAGDEIPQEIWDELHAEGLIRNTSHGVPGADMDTTTTPEGADALLAVLTRAEVA